VSPIPITVRCECGETHKAKLGERVDCSCGRSYETSDLPSGRFDQVRAHQAKAKLYVRVGVVFIAGAAVTSFLVWGIWAAAITTPLAGMLWFWYIRRWFMRRFVVSPGELPTFELEASQE
jgi:hypothetical protein